MKKGHTANPKNKHGHAPYYAPEITKGEDRGKQIFLRVKHHSNYLTHTPPTSVHKDTYEVEVGGMRRIKEEEDKVSSCTPHASNGRGFTKLFYLASSLFLCSAISCFHTP